MAEEPMTVMVEDAQILWPNFTGREGQYNRLGDRNFTLLLPEDVAEQMVKDGWNVRWLEPRDEGDPPRAAIEVAVKYKIRPPRVTIITSQTKRRTLLGEELVGMLDHADIMKADILIRAYHWEVGDKTGVKAYLQTAYFTIYEDPLEAKYNAPAKPADEED